MKNKKIKIVLLISILFILLITLVGIAYVYKSHRDISKEEVFYETKAENFVQDIIISKKSISKYLDKTIVISGEITSIDSKNKNLVIFQKISANFVNLPTSIQIGQEVKCKGRVVGYDDLLEEIILDQCTIQND